MSNENHQLILQKGVEVWNKWRQDNPDVRPILRNINLSGKNFDGIDLRKAILIGTDLRYTSLFKANLQEAILSTATLFGADIHSATLCNADLRWVDLRNTSLQWTDLRNVDFSHADLSGANLLEANLSSAKLQASCLDGAVLARANLSGADFTRSKLGRAELILANLMGTNFSEANLTEAGLTGVKAIATNFKRATLTGACIEDWHFPQTNFDGVSCKYVFLSNQQQKRCPSNRDFEPGEFTKWCQEKQDRDTRFIPTSMLFEKDKPEENLRNLAKLIDVLRIEAVFDPYLDDEGLSNLLRIASLGVSFAPNLRILSSKDPNRSPRFTQLRIQNFFRTLSISGEVRKLPKDEQHRRFMLLNDGSSLIIGCSLNDVSKDEKARVEFDREDRMFFDSMWSSAQRIDERSS